MRKSRFIEESKGLLFLIRIILGFIVIGAFLIGVVYILPSYMEKIASFDGWVLIIFAVLGLVGMVIVGIGWVCEKLKNS